MIANKKILFILNPTSQHGECAKLEPVLKRIAESQKLNFELVRTKYPLHAQEIAAGAAAYDIVAAVGGDGTVHEVVNGLMQIGSKKRPAFTSLPCGSGSDFCRTIAMPLDFSIAVDAFLSGREVLCDIGKCNGEYYAYSASVGLDAEIATKAIELEQTTKLSGNPLYMRAASICIFKNYRHRLITYSIDDAEPCKQDLLMFCVNNGMYYGGGTKVAPAARVDDGLLNYCFAENMPAAKAMGALGTMVIGKHEKNSKVHSGTGKKFVVDCMEPVRAQLDGEPKWDSHYEFEVVPGALKFIVPQDSWVGATDIATPIDSSSFDGDHDAGDHIEQMLHAADSKLKGLFRKEIEKQTDEAKDEEIENKEEN